MLDGDNDDFTPPLFDDPNPNPYEYTIEQILHFEERYQNGFDVFIDDDYVRWLSIEHPEALPAHLRTFEENPLPVTKPSEVTVHGDDSEPTYTDGSEVDSHDKDDYSDSEHYGRTDGSGGEEVSCNKTAPEVPKSSTPKSAKPSTSSAISEFLTTPHVSNKPNTSAKKAFSARVLTSAESLAMINEKRRQKEEEEEAKAKRKEDREIKKQQREAEKVKKKQEMELKKQQREAAKEKKKQEMELKKQQREAEKQKKAEEKAKKMGERKKRSVPQKKQTRSATNTVSANSESDTVSCQCAVCYGGYNEDIVYGQLIQTWVQCTLPTCSMWMHEDCVDSNPEGKYLICPLCDNVIIYIQT